MVRRFDANLGFLFLELPLLERFDAARQAGFMGVELMSPESASPKQIANAARDAGVEIVLCNSPVGDLVSGGLGLSGVPGRQQEFQEVMQWVADFAETIGCQRVNVGPSRVAAEGERNACLGVLAENLRFAGELLGERRITALIEPLNTRDFDRVLLSSVDSAMNVIRASDHPNVALQFDIYHMHQMHDDAIAALEENIASVGHVQFADMPGRGAPGTGSIDFGMLFSTLDRLDYAGWLGAEYRASERTEQSLAWLERYRG